MNHRPFIILAPAAAAFCGWMLSGSPLPMALTFAVAGVALVTRFRIRDGAFGMRGLVAASVLAVAAMLLEIHLFREGRANVTRAELPPAFHPALAALWWASLVPAGLVGHLRNALAWCGSLAVLASAMATDSYDFGPWQIAAVASLPLALWTCRILRPEKMHRLALVAAFVSIVLVSSSVARHAVFVTDHVSAWLNPDKSTEREAGSAPPLSESSSGGGSDGASRRLPRDGEVHYRNEILVMIQAHSPALFRAWTREPLYLRTSTLALFESEEVLSPIRSGRWIYDIDDGDEDRTIPFTRSETKAVLDPRAYHTLYVRHEGADHLPLLDGTRAIIAPAVYEFADDWYQMSPSDEFSQFRYTAIGSLESHDPVRSGDLKGERRIPIPEIYLQRPPTPLSGRVAELCAGLSGSDPLDAIRDHLHQRNHYSLRFETPAESTPLHEFFFGHGRGHCEHYAVATVLMLRCLGIPARVAYGYAGGLADPQQRVLAFRDRDFHAWAEILTPDNRWHVFDTTPQAPGAAARIATSSALPPVASTAYQDLSDFDPAGIQTDSFFAEWLAMAMTSFESHFLAITAAAVALLGFLWLRLSKRSVDAFAPSPVGKSPPVSRSPVLRELERLAEVLPKPRKPGQTWREYLTASEGILPPVAGDAVAYHYRLTYAGDTPDLSEESRIVDALRTWRKNRSTE